MIPYIEVNSYSLGESFHLHPFGVLVVTGCIVGYFSARYHALSRGLNSSHFLRLTVWVLILGFLFSRWFSWALYFPDVPMRNPLELFAIQTSMSSYEGFLGGILAALFYLHRYKLPTLEYIDALVFGLAIGWFFGRLGCTLVHDHPGTYTDFFLGINYPDGTKHDLGFYEWLYTILLNVVLLTIRGRKLPAGILSGIVCVCYTPVRFLFDFLRIAENKYYGLTLGQYFSILFFLLGCWLLAKNKSA